MERVSLFFFAPQLSHTARRVAGGALWRRTFHSMIQR